MLTISDRRWVLKPCGPISTVRRALAASCCEIANALIDERISPHQSV